MGPTDGPPMHDDPSSNPNDAPSELGAYEAIRHAKDAEPAPEPAAFACPACGRMVESGFRFCDGCGSSLENKEARTAPQSTELISPPYPSSRAQVPLLERWRGRLKERRAGGVTARAGTGEPTSLLDRLRRRRGVHSEIAEAEQSMYEPPPRLEYGAPPRLEPTAEIMDSPEAPRHVSGATSPPVPAEELRGSIGGKLQWSEEESVLSAGSQPEAPSVEQQEAFATWRPVAVPTQEEGKGFRPWRFAIQVLIGFVSGALVLGLVTVIASLASDGTVAVLEMRGLPIFIGGAVSIVVFALLTTGRRTSAIGAKRSGAIATVIAGLVVLIVLAAVVYQPGIAVRAQPRIDRALGIFGAADEEAVVGFQQDIVEWNDASDQYQNLLEAQLRRGIDFNRFRSRAGAFERTLVDLVAQMRARAGAAQNPELRDALGDLASIYQDQVGGLRTVNRGILIDGLDLVRTGDRRYKDARVRAGALFADRLRALLDRAGFDSDAFGEAIGG